MRNDALLKRLSDLQGDRTDEAFAADLGIHRATWTHIKNGDRGLGGIVLGKVLARWPELVSLLNGDNRAA